MASPDPLKNYRLYAAMFLLNLAVVVGVIYLLTREAPREIVVTTQPAQPSANDGKTVSQPPAANSEKQVPTSASGAVNDGPTPALKNLKPASSKINLNTATLDELDSLPGIGPALAKRIVDYRTEKGGFANIAEVKEVRGIGETLFDEMKELITVQ